MTDDRAALGARIAEAMGWEKIQGSMWPPTGGGPPRAPEWFVTWEGYGIVDAWMREQGYRRDVSTYPNGHVSVNYRRWPHGGNRDRGGAGFNYEGDEPLAALQAVEKALEVRE